MKLFLTEMRKVWKSGQFILLTGVLILANLLMLSIMTENSENEPSPSAWKKLDLKMQGMSMAEKQDWVTREYERVSALDIINQIYELSGKAPKAYIDELKATYSDAFQTYQKLYLSGKYLRYAQNITSEYALVSQVQKEISSVSDYKTYIENIQKRAQMMANISIFQSADGESFDERCIRQAAEKYSSMGDIDIRYSTQKGIVTALKFCLTDILLIIFMLTVTGELIRHEKDSGMMTLIWTTPGGGIRSSMAKYAAMTVNMALMSIVLYISNLIYCGALYGLGDLSRSIQSVPDFKQCLMQVSVAGYILIFLLFKCAAAWIIGLWVLTAAVLTEKLWSEALLSLLFILGQWGLRISATPGSRLALLRCSSLMSFMDTNELLGNYAQLNIFGYPVFRLTVEVMAAVVWVILLSLGYILAMKKMSVLKRTGSVRQLRSGVKLRRKTGRSLSAFEWYKLMIGKRGWIFGSIFLGLCLYMGFSQETSADAQEVLYKKYVTMFEGQITQSKVENMVAINRQFEDIYMIEDEYAYGVLDSEAYTYLQMYHGNRIFEKNIFVAACNEKIQYLQENPGAWIVYDRGYAQVFDFSGKKDSVMMLAVMLMLCILLTPVFAEERNTEFYKIVLTTPEGYQKIVQKRLGIAWVISLCVSAMTLAVNIIPAIQNMSLASLLAPAKSLSMYTYMPVGVSLGMMILFQLLLRSLGCMIAVIVIYMFSWKAGKLLPAVCCEMTVLCLPAFLAWRGMTSFYWFSLYPLFHACAYMGNAAAFGTVLLFGISAVCLACALGIYLVLDYRKAGYQ